MFWVINLVISGWINGISVGLGEDFRENPCSDLGVGAAALSQAPRGCGARGALGHSAQVPGAAGLRALAPRGPLVGGHFGEFLEPVSRGLSGLCSGYC